MLIKAEVDLNDFYEAFNGEKIEEEITAELKDQIMKIVKRDPRYKAYINQKAEETLAGLKL